MPSAPQLLFSLKAWSETWPRELTDTLIEVYRVALHDLTDEQLATATTRTLRECTFFPVPAEVRKRAGMMTQVAPNTTAIVRSIEALGISIPASGWHAPNVETVRRALGDTIATAYGYVGASRLFADSGTTRDIAWRDFAESLVDAVQANPLTLQLTAAGVRELQPLAQHRQLKAGKVSR